jgi:hypothetical protein
LSRFSYACLLVLSTLGLTAVGGLHLVSADPVAAPLGAPWPAALTDPKAAPPASPRTSPGAPEATSGPTSTPGVTRLEMATGVVPGDRPVRIDGPGLATWALLDRRTGRLTGSPNHTVTGEALAIVTPWLAADQLRRADEDGETPDAARLRRLSAIVRGEDVSAADALYRESGGDASIRRMVSVCGLTDSRPGPRRWGSTIISARDSARLGLCLADGRAAGERWTSWLLGELRRVDGDGAFGVREALPARAGAALSIRNGWQLDADEANWRVNCLAVNERWVLGVLTRYPARLGLPHGKRLCRSIGEQLLTDDSQAR